MTPANIAGYSDQVDIRVMVCFESLNSLDGVKFYPFWQLTNKYDY